MNVISFRRIKQIYKRRCFKKYGKKFRFDPDSIFINPHLMEFGSNVYIGEKAYFSTQKGITIGDGVMFGPYPMIISGDHNYSVVGRRMSEVCTGGANGTVAIGNDVWIGARVTILKNVTIGEGSVIGAGSVVTKDIPSYTIAYGNPCRPKRRRFEVSDIIMHLDVIHSLLSAEQVLSIWQYHNLL